MVKTLIDTLVVFLLAVANTGTAALVYQYTDASRLAATLIASIVWIAFGVYVLSEKKKQQTGYDRIAGVLAIRMEDDMRPSNNQADLMKSEKKENYDDMLVRKCRENMQAKREKEKIANEKRSRAAQKRARGKDGKFV